MFFCKYKRCGLELQPPLDYRRYKNYSSRYDVLRQIKGAERTKIFRKESGLEIDFVMRYKGECVLVECKARTGNAKSMRTVLTNPEKYHVMNAIKICDYNVGRDGALLTIPFYMAFLLTEM